MQTSATLAGTRPATSSLTPLRGGRRIRVEATLLHVAAGTDQLRVIHPATKANVAKYRGELDAAPLLGCLTAGLRHLLRAETADNGVSALTLRVRPHGTRRWALSISYRTAAGEKVSYPDEAPAAPSADTSLDQLDAVPVSEDPEDWIRVVRGLIRLAVARHGHTPDPAEQIAASTALWHPVVPAPRRAPTR